MLRPESAKGWCIGFTSPSDAAPRFVDADWLQIIEQAEGTRWEQGTLACYIGSQPHMNSIPRTECKAALRERALCKSVRIFHRRMGTGSKITIHSSTLTVFYFLDTIHRHFSFETTFRRPNTPSIFRWELNPLDAANPYWLEPNKIFIWGRRQSPLFKILF